MPKPKHHIDTEHLHSLVRSVENRLGFRLDSPARCKKAENLFKLQGCSVSYSTLLRLSRQPIKSHAFFLSTLDELSRFLGHQTWDSFKYNCIRDSLFLEWTGAADECGRRSLISLCIERNEFRSLFSFVEQLSPEMAVDDAIRLAYQFFQALQNYPSNNKLFFREFSQVPFIRKAFFEYLADPFFRIPHYDFGLQEYLKATDFRRDTASLQDFVFAQCLLLRHAFNRSDFKAVKRIGMVLYETDEIAERISLINIFPRTRFLCYRILWMKCLGKISETEQLKDDLGREFCEVAKTARPFEQEAMLNILLDVHLLTGTDREQCIRLVLMFCSAGMKISLKDLNDLKAVLDVTDHTRVDWIAKGIYR
jgi:hypothetical protein